MRVIFDGEIQSCCRECGKDTRHSIEFARGPNMIVIVPLCGLHLCTLGENIDAAVIENTIL